MGNNLTQYRGWDINASYYVGSNGHMPTVTITKHTGDSAIDKQLTPPSGNGFKTDNEAYAAAWTTLKR